MITYDTNLWRQVDTDPGQIRVDDANLRLRFKTLYRNIKGFGVEVGRQENENTTVYGNLEAARLVNCGRGAMSQKWDKRFQTPDFVIRVGEMIIYASEENYEAAIEIALGQRKATNWIRQEIVWVARGGEETHRNLSFLNLSGFKKVPPAKWFLHRPREYRFERRELSPASVALGFTKVDEYAAMDGHYYPVWGRLERYGGANSFVVTEQTMLFERVLEWMRDSGWFYDEPSRTAVRGYETSLESIRFADDVGYRNCGYQQAKCLIPAVA